MSDWFPGKIEIAGAVPRSLADQLAEKIAETGASLEWGGETFAPANADDLLAAVDEETKLLAIYDELARYGAFSSLETWLEESGIAFTRTSDARYEFSGEVVQFRPGLELVARFATQDGIETVVLGEVQAARVLLREALAQRSPEKVRAALAVLDDALGPEVPALVPFSIVEADT